MNPDERRPAEPETAAARLFDVVLPAVARLMLFVGLGLMCLTLLCRLAPMNATTSVVNLLAIACTALVSLTGLAYLVIHRALGHDGADISDRHARIAPAADPRPIRRSRPELPE